LHPTKVLLNAEVYDYRADRNRFLARTQEEGKIVCVKPRRSTSSRSCLEIHTMKTRIPRVIVTLLVVCFGLLLKLQAVNPPRDGGYPGGNTAEGQNALLNLTTGTYNTAVGFLSLSNTNSDFNTGVGAGTLLASSGSDNTAIGAQGAFGLLTRIVTTESVSLYTLTKGYLRFWNWNRRLS
jgi:hypothetical protein